MKPHDRQHEVQGATEGESTGIIVPFPVTHKRNAITGLGHSESDADANAKSAVQEELRMVQTRDALRRIVEELEAVQRRVAVVVASR